MSREIEDKVQILELFSAQATLPRSPIILVQDPLACYQLSIHYTGQS